MAKDALGAHARDELGISDTLSARPVQAAFASAGSFTVGAFLPLVLVLLVPDPPWSGRCPAARLLFLALLGSLAARAGGSPVWISVARVTFWGALAMASDRRGGSFVWSDTLSDRPDFTMSDTTASLRRKISSAGDLQSVVRTMKALAASSIGQYEKSVRALGDYYRTVELGLGACFRENEPAALTVERKGQTDAGAIGAVVFGSDQGLVGQFNDVVADFAVKTLAALPGKSQVWAVGERVHARLADAGLPLVGLFTVPNSVKTITPLVGQILVEHETHHDRGEVTELHLFYNRPTSGSGLCARPSATAPAGRNLASQAGRPSLADEELARGHGRGHRDLAGADPRISFRLTLPRVR